MKVVNRVRIEDELNNLGGEESSDCTKDMMIFLMMIAEKF